MDGLSCIDCVILCSFCTRRLQFQIDFRDELHFSGEVTPKKLRHPPAHCTPLKNVEWLTDVREMHYAIDQMHPLRVWHYHDKKADPLFTPSDSYPWKHPYCELNYLFEGSLTEYIGAEQIERSAGEIMMVGPGTPHYAVWRSRARRIVAVHFFPMMLFAMGPGGDGARALASFTMAKSIGERVVRLPESIRKKVSRALERMIVDFESKEAGSQFSLCRHFMEILIEILRMDEESGRVSYTSAPPVDWAQFVKTLRYMHEHYSEPLYVEQLARATGLSGTRLQSLFHEVLGMSCVQYLRTYRISHAAAMLCSPNARVTDVALDVGFATPSHFNTSFRRLLGMSPTEYVRKNSQKRS